VRQGIEINTSNKAKSFFFEEKNEKTFAFFDAIQ